MPIESQHEGAPGLGFETWDIYTMQALDFAGVADISMTLSLICARSEASASASISTGKERDAESGNDYFGARYYASTMGRFLSPDWSAKAEPVPYAKLDNPQTLNLYQYMGNNPLGGVDADGHDFWDKLNNLVHGNGFRNTPPPQAAFTPDPARTRPMPTMGPGTHPDPSTARRPAASLTVGGGVSGNAEAGAAVAGAGANGAYYKAVSINTDGKAQLGDVAAGAAVAYAGDHVAAASAQDKTPLIGGAYAGVGLSAFIANTPTVQDVGGPFEATQVNIPFASVQLANDKAGDWELSVTVGPATPSASVFNMTTMTHVDCELACH